MNYIDLLIVDEAGQTSPEVAAASFALAKKAIVVGDEHQIPPVWGVSRPLDQALAVESRVIQKIEEFTELEESGLNTSQSSVMKLAYNACPYGDEIFLSEHRRCYNEIIDYCNKLVYRGRLQPLRGLGRDDPKRPELMKQYPVIGCHDIKQDASEKVGGSRKNPKEAEGIARWIWENFAKIQEAYSKEQENVLAVITPFTAQKHEIEKKLRKFYPHGSSPVKVGTVHTFQGAENKIIIFSPTYGAEDSGFFIEKNSNLMNVAVSRAQDAFWVFGSKKCLSKGAKANPMGMLYNYVSGNCF